MSQSDAARDIETIAAEWAVRVDVNTMDPVAHDTLQAWLAVDSRHRGAFLRAQAGLRLLDHSSVVREMLPLASETPAQPCFGRMAVIASRIGLAVTALAASVGALVLFLPRSHHYSTSIGEQRRVALQDGSIAIINTDSEMDVAFVGDRRQVELHHGEAWFQVAKDHAWPFVVDAGDVHVRATGTAFSVRRRGESAEVVVTEGRVIAWKDDTASRPVTISAGEVATIARNFESVRPSHTEDVLAWRRGEIVLTGQTIATAVAEFNRYNVRKIVVRDPAVGSVTLVGYFLIDQPSQFARAAALAAGRGMSENGQEIVIE